MITTGHVCQGNLQRANGKLSNRRPGILAVGVGFKPGQSVISCSPSLSFASSLNDLGCEKLTYHNPLVE